MNIITTNVPVSRRYAGKIICSLVLVPLACALMVAPASLRAALPSGTVAYYPFQGSAADASGSGNHLQATAGVPQYLNGDGPFGGALYLDGGTTLGTVSGSFPTGVPTGNSPYTVACFVKAAAGGTWIGYGSAAQKQCNNFWMSTYSTVLNWWYNADLGAAVPNGRDFRDGWHAVVGTWDGTTRKIYVDGLLMSSDTPGAAAVTTASFYVGANIANSTLFNGCLAELMIVNRALTLAEVQAYSASGGIGTSLPAATAAYYKFQGSINDSGPFGNNLKTTAGTLQFTNSGGPFGGALYLDGATTLGTVAGLFPTAVPTNSNPYTVACFIKADAGANTLGGWIGYGQNGTTKLANNFRMDGYSGIDDYWWNADLPATVPNSRNFQDGWHSVVGTWDGTTRKIYIDGLLQASDTPGAPNFQTNSFVIGKTLNDANFKGWVAELLLASRAFSLAEVQAYNTYGGTGKPATTTALVASPGFPATGSNVTFTATVQTNSVTLTNATGTVVFMDSGLTLGSSSVSNGTASFSTSALVPGSHSVTAQYSSDTNYAASVSSNVMVTVAVAQISVPAGYVAVVGVAAGAFNPALWQSGPPNLVPDYRFPWLSPLAGAYRNIYAPSAVQTPTGYRVFYGGWDGIATGNDHIYSLTTDAGFQTMASRHQVVQQGGYVHINNVNALGFTDGSYAMFGTLYPVGPWNKPAFFRSDSTGASWNGGLGEPYTVGGGDVVSVTGYPPNWANADVNGMNVMLIENGLYRLYFGDFQNFNGVYRATSTDGKNYTYDGQVLSGTCNVNDVKTFVVGGTNYYLMGAHLNGASLLYSLSTNGLQFPNLTTLLNYQNVNSDRYIVAMGWVVSGAQGTTGRKLLGVLYGAGPNSGLAQNSIFARWFQKKIVFVADNGNRYPGTYSLGPDCQLLSIPVGQFTGHFEYYAEDGVTLTGVSGTLTVSQGQSYRLPVAAVSIPKLFNTGVAAGGALLGGSTTDPHYTLSASADASYPGPNAVTVNSVWPLAPGAWLANGPASAWIAPRADQSAGNAPGTYTYRTTFDLTGYDPATASIAGSVAVDDSLTDIRLNGHSVGTVSAGFGSLTGFTIVAGSTNFVAGSNTLDFVVFNNGTGNNPTGLRVEMAGTVAVPPPTLTAVSSGGQIVLSWPAISGGYSLFSTPSLSPAAWILYSGTLTTNSGQITVLVPMNGTNGFFRLQQ